MKAEGAVEEEAEEEVGTEVVPLEEGSGEGEGRLTDSDPDFLFASLLSIEYNSKRNP